MTQVAKKRASTVAASIILALGVGVVGCSGEAEPEATVERAPFLIDQDFADPDVVHGDDGYVAFATENQGANVQFATSTDLVTWDAVSYTHLTLPTTPYV